MNDWSAHLLPIQFIVILHFLIIATLPEGYTRQAVTIEQIIRQVSEQPGFAQPQKRYVVLFTSAETSKFRCGVTVCICSYNVINLGEQPFVAATMASTCDLCEKVGDHADPSQQL